MKLGWESPGSETYLSEPLEVQDENVRQGPEAELDAALLQLLAVRTAPSVVWCQLEHNTLQETAVNI